MSNNLIFKSFKRTTETLFMSGRDCAGWAARAARVLRAQQTRVSVNTRGVGEYAQFELLSRGVQSLGIL